MAAKKQELMVPMSEKDLALARAEFPADDSGYTQVLLPRLTMTSQDKTEGKGKQMKVVEEAGTFFIERQSDEKDKDGKLKWDRTEIGTGLKAIILFQRKQLRFYDADAKKFTSSPIYDTDDEVLPLFCDKKEVGRGTPAELKALEEYQGFTSKNKPTSKLEDNRILYVLHEGEVFQLNLRSTSMYAYKNYVRDLNKEGGLVPSTVMTEFGSEAMENGATRWNGMTFDNVRTLSKKEFEEAMVKVAEIKQGIEDIKAHFASRNAVAPKTDGQKKAAKEAGNF